MNKLLIVGLGNPGSKYTHTRHNFGFLAVDALALKNDAKWTERQTLEAELAEFNQEDTKVFLLKPLTFMNNSGQAVATIMQKEGIESSQLIVIHDEVDLPFGEFRLQSDKNSAGHKGVESIIRSIGTKDFRRLRLGVGKSDIVPTEAYVLQNFADEELSQLPNIINPALAILLT